LKREYWNISSALLMQMVSVICGLIAPRLLISTYGSEAYGITVSIAQFLSCISLLEGGLGAVARAELYAPLVESDVCEIGRIYNSTKRYFRRLGIVFAVYTLFLAFCFHDIGAVSLWDRTFSFCLVLVMGFSAALQYVIGVSDGILLNADRRNYVSQLSYALCTALNTVVLFRLTGMDCTLLTVKLGTAMIFLMRPFLLGYWRKKHFPVLPKGKFRPLTQSRYGFGQHMAYFLHRNTDIMILTLLGDFKLTAIYSVYLLVCANLRNLCISFSAGMEAELGKCYAEQKRLEETFLRYEKRMNKLSFGLFAVAALLILPFVGLYTADIQDVDYQQPMFAALLLLAELQYCQLQPVYALTLATNRFKETRLTAYGEAVLNIVLSCLLMRIWEPLPALAAGTVLAQSLRALWLRHYIRKQFFSVSALWKTAVPMFLVFVMISVPLPITSWLQWLCWGCTLTFAAVVLLFGKELLHFAERRWKR